MKVKELIIALQKLDPSQDVLLNWEGQLVPVKKVEAITVKQYSDGTSNYFPELPLEDGEVRSEAVLVD